jgi:hypothetical protein
MPDPDDRDVLVAGPLDQGGDVRHDCVALMRLGDDPDLHVHDKECGVGSVLECGHPDALLAPFPPFRE